jgi:hypothetical protein
MKEEGRGGGKMERRGMGEGGMMMMMITYDDDKLNL